MDEPHGPGSDSKEYDSYSKLTCTAMTANSLSESISQPAVLRSTTANTMRLDKKCLLRHHEALPTTGSELQGSRKAQKKGLL